MTRTVVIVHPGALGDILLALPALQRLRARFPGHQISLCANEQPSEFLSECGVIDRWLPVQGLDCMGLFSGSVSPAGELFDWLARCDLAVGWIKDQDNTIGHTLKKYARQATVVVGSPFSSTSVMHQSDRFLDILGELSVGHLLSVRLSLPEHLIEQGQARLRQAGVFMDRPVALIHPGSGSRHKCVKPQVLARVMKSLETEGAIAVLLEGPADAEMIAEVIDHLSPPPITLRNFGLGELAGVLSQVRLYVGHDSGITHLSAAVGAATVAIFGPTDADRWAPRGSHVRVLRGTTCGCPDWEAVRRCADKSCLPSSAQDILTLCRDQLLQCNP